MLCLYYDGVVRLKEVPPPSLQAGEALVQVHLAGVCRTDLEVIKGYHRFVGILGHEFVGSVVGPETSPWLGRRVVGEITVSCGECPRCLEGLKGHCSTRQVLGLLDRPGVFAQYVAVPEVNLHALPPGLPDEVAVFVEPLAAAVAVPEAAPSLGGGPVLVIGDGNLGLLISWVLALTGAEVHLVGHYPEHLDLARPYGVHTFLEGDLPPGEYNLIVEASGATSGLDLALARIRPQGTIILKSTYAGHYGLDPARLVVPEVRLVGSRCGPFPAALRLLRQGWLAPRPLIARTFPLSQGAAALDYARQPGVLKVLLDCRA